MHIMDLKTAGVSSISNDILKEVPWVNNRHSVRTSVTVTVLSNHISACNQYATATCGSTLTELPLFVAACNAGVD